MPVEEQVVAIYAGVRGYLDTIRVEDVTRFEQQMLSEVRAKQGGILAAIRDEKEISEATEGKLKAFMEGFVKTFA